MGSESPGISHSSLTFGHGRYHRGSAHPFGDPDWASSPTDWGATSHLFAMSYQGLYQHHTLHYFFGRLHLNLPNLYDKMVSCESSLGISLNSELQNIIKDSINIFLNLSLIPVETISDGIPILRGSKGYEGIDVEFRDLEFHDNEEANYSVVSRVFNDIYKLQKSILDVIIKEEGKGVQTNVANEEELY